MIHATHISQVNMRRRLIALGADLNDPNSKRLLAGAVHLTASDGIFIVDSATTMQAERAAGVDIGDQVVASLESRRTQLPHVRGTQPLPSPKRAPKAAAPSGGGDLGDQVVAALENQRGYRPAQQAVAP